MGVWLGSGCFRKMPSWADWGPAGTDDVLRVFCTYAEPAKSTCCTEQQETDLPLSAIGHDLAKHSASLKGCGACRGLFVKWDGQGRDA